jgi:hypothetical protein
MESGPGPQELVSIGHPCRLSVEACLGGKQDVAFENEDEDISRKHVMPQQKYNASFWVGAARDELANAQLATRYA